MKKSKKKQKELAKKRQEELDARDQDAQEYTESACFHPATLYLCLDDLTDWMVLSAEDLDGLKVSHDLSALEEGENRILTLRDSRILDNEGASTSLSISICPK